MSASTAIAVAHAIIVQPLPPLAPSQSLQPSGIGVVMPLPCGAGPAMATPDIAWTDRAEAKARQSVTIQQRRHTERLMK